MNLNSPDSFRRHALHAAVRRGWLMLSAGAPDSLVDRWHQYCQSRNQPFAVLRSQAERSTLWIILAPDREFCAVGQSLISDALSGAINFVLTRSSITATIASGKEAALMMRLLQIVSFATYPRANLYLLAE